MCQLICYLKRASILLIYSTLSKYINEILLFLLLEWQTECHISIYSTRSSYYPFCLIAERILYMSLKGFVVDHTNGISFNSKTLLLKDKFNQFCFIGPERVPMPAALPFHRL